MASTTARNLRPAYGDLQAAVLFMAVRYAEAHADWACSLTDPAIRATARNRIWRTVDRRFKALARLTAALANQ